jgi:NAD-dependent deacetylase
MTDADAVKRLHALLAASRRVVAFTGAGISTESGIPDFRSPGGFWSRYPPIPFEEFLASAEARREAWRRRRALDRELAGVRPNRGHLALADLHRAGRLRAIVTQNFDGLHQQAGVPPELVVELHGTFGHAACLACGLRHEIAPILDCLERTGDPPDCSACGGLLKTATISFGQPMPQAAMRRAEEAALDCDLFLVLGSSLVVYPAAGLPHRARGAGARLALINRDPTPLDTMADLVIHADIGHLLATATNGLPRTTSEEP